MKTFNSLSLFFFLFVLISIPSSHSRTFQNLVEYTCKKTPNYNVCIESLKSNPGSSSTSLRDLALIMVDVLKEKVNDALNKIHELQNAGTEPKQGLESCASKYNRIISVDVPAAIESLKKEVGKTAVKVANNDANEAANCESESNGTLTTQNNALHDVAIVAAAVAGQLFTN